MFVIEDENHAEQSGEFATLEEALAELRRRALIPWNDEPNVAPCTSWKTCGRDYEILEYDDHARPWKIVRRVAGFEVSAAGVVWSEGSSGEE